MAWPDFSGQWLREQRKARGLTQAQLADLLGVSSVSMSNWECEHTRPTAKNLWNLLRTLDDPDTVGVHW